MATDEISGTSRSDGIIKIYHGSSRIIKAPVYLFENKNTDYGHGFYTTQNKGLASEWAVLSSGLDGYINEYTLNCSVSKENLIEAMHFGDLGIQICLKSKKAYDTVQYLTYYKASIKQYYNSAKYRDDEARKQYRLLKNKARGTTVLDMIGDEDD